jgi:glycosyltransferase involved in cell wall biosynthesis
MRKLLNDAALTIYAFRVRTPYMPKRIVFDAFELAPGTGKSLGVYNYADRLLAAMGAEVPNGADLIVLCNPANETDVRRAVGKCAAVQVIGKQAPGRVRRQIWQFATAAHWLRRLHGDVYFSPRGYLPYGVGRGGRARSVVVCHDLIRLWYSDHHPHHFGWLEHALLVSGALRTLRRSDAVIAISQATADDIQKRVPDATPVHVVHNGIPLVESGPPPRPDAYLFAVTSPLPHKNPDGLLAAYAAYRSRVSQPLPLVVCGIGDPGAPGVHAVRGLTDAALHAYYASASGFLFLPWIEGFGFPPLEALRHGTPVLCSDIAALREVTLGKARYAPPGDAQATADQIVDMLADSAPRADASLMRELELRFSWPVCARAVWRVLLDTSGEC